MELCHMCSNPVSWYFDGRCKEQMRGMWVKPDFGPGLKPRPSEYTVAAQRLRCCATNLKVAGSVPDGMSGFFIGIKSFRSHYGPGVDSAQRLRCCATKVKVAGSIPDGVSGFFIDIKSLRSHYGPGVDSASNRNEYQEYFLGVKVARCVRLTLPPSWVIVT